MAWWHGPDCGSTLAEVVMVSGRLVAPWPAWGRLSAPVVLAGLVTLRKYAEAMRKRNHL
jgi:hypothetical protein